MILRGPTVLGSARGIAVAVAVGMNRFLSLALALAAVPLAVRGEALRPAADPEPTDVPRRVELDGQTRLPLELFAGKAVVEATVDGRGPSLCGF